MVSYIKTPKWLYKKASEVNVEKPFLNIPNFLEDNKLMDKFNKYYGYTPLENWLNITVYRDVENSFGWHNEQGQGFRDELKTHKGDMAEIIWISGAQDKGGELLVLDDKDMIVKIPYEINKIIRMSIATMHMVDPYYDRVKPRISLNTTFFKS